MPWAELKEILGEMLDALDDFDCARARDLLMRTVTEYRPESGIQDLVWVQAQKNEPELANVTDIRAHRARTARTAGGVSAPSVDAVTLPDQQLLQ